jgi:hypothetical protein
MTQIQFIAEVGQTRCFAALIGMIDHDSIMAEPMG